MKTADLPKIVIRDIDCEAFMEYIDPDWRERGFPDAEYGFCRYIEYMSPAEFNKVLREYQ